jgi:hypothetical protein
MHPHGIYTLVSRGRILILHSISHVDDLAFSDHTPNYTSTVTMLRTIPLYDDILILSILVHVRVQFNYLSYGILCAVCATAVVM